MRAKEFLLEYNRQLTIQNFGDRVINQFKKEGERAWGMILVMFIAHAVVMGGGVWILFSM